MREWGPNPWPRRLVQHWIEESVNPPDSSGIVDEVAAEDATLGTPIPIATALLTRMRAGGLVQRRARA